MTAPSSPTKLYGTTSEERLLKEKQGSREIVKEILDFGITDRQKYQIVKLLAENFDNYLHMQVTTWLINELQKTDVGDLTGLKERAMEQLAAQQADENNEGGG